MSVNQRKKTAAIWISGAIGLVAGLSLATVALVWLAPEVRANGMRFLTGARVENPLSPAPMQVAALGPGEIAGDSVSDTVAAAFTRLDDVAVGHYPGGAPLEEEPIAQGAGPAAAETISDSPAVEAARTIETGLEGARGVEEPVPTAAAAEPANQGQSPIQTIAHVVGGTRPQERPDLLNAAPSLPALADGASRAIRDCPTCPELVRIAGGNFMMGDVSGEGDNDEQPVRRVSIAPFMLGKFEVTWGEWEVCSAAGACPATLDDAGWGRERRPVINVSRSDALAYLRWLSIQTGKTYRLPSEAEWEFAARAGGAEGIGVARDELCAHANGADAGADYAWRNLACRDGYSGSTAPVGSFAANAFGLHDMIGNAWEWAADCWHPNYEGAPRTGAPWTSACAGKRLVLRGGAFSVDPEKLRPTYRYAFENERMPFFSFRVARDG